MDASGVMSIVQMAHILWQVDICLEERIGRFETNKRAKEALNQDDLSKWQSGLLLN